MDICFFTQNLFLSEVGDILVTLIDKCFFVLLAVIFCTELANKILQ